MKAKDARNVAIAVPLVILNIPTFAAFGAVYGIAKLCGAELPGLACTKSKS